MSILKEESEFFESWQFKHYELSGLDYSDLADQH